MPDHPDAGWNLGRALLERAEADEAYLHLRRAAALRPGWERWHGLGRACQARGDLTGAEAAYGRALADRPDAAETLNNLANLYQDAGRLEAALALQDRALGIALGNPDMHYNRALLLLLLGRWAEGWREHEWRWQAAGFASPRRRFASPAWDGGPLPGGTLLLHWEQGLGDTIQIRPICRRRPRPRRPADADVQPALVPLVRGLPGLDAVVTAGDLVPPHDAHAPLLSLPLLLGQPVPAPRSPYLAAPGVAREAGRIGLVWAGNPKHLNDRNRSIPLPLLAPLLAAPGRRWVSLQVGPRSADIAAAGLAGRLEDLSPPWSTSPPPRRRSPDWICSSPWIPPSPISPAHSASRPGCCCPSRRIGAGVLPAPPRPGTAAFASGASRRRVTGPRCCRIFIQSPCNLPQAIDGPAQVFVSYSRQDGQTVDQLVEQIQHLGYTVWIDRQSNWLATLCSVDCAGYSGLLDW